MNGRNRRVVVSKSSSVTHPFGLDVLDDQVYWTDWNHRGILRASKFDGQNSTILAQTTLLPYGIKVYHEAAQPSANAEVCKEKNCAHMCLLAENGAKGVCGCADGYVMGKDKRSCAEDCKDGSNSIVCGGSDPK